jgi:GrpB-like predicted nucleotidyltransferase (UPF0157 family)
MATLLPPQAGIILPRAKMERGKIEATMSRIVKMHPHNQDWAAEYQTIAAQLKPIFGKQLLLIEHIGSTSIPGIKAKPIIDVLIAVTDIGRVTEIVPAMETLGYDFRGERGIPGRQYFRMEPDSSSGIHIHVYQQGHEAITEKLDFRDYMRTHPDRAQAYSQLKEKLAEKFRQDRVTYTESKADFIVETIGLAADWRKDQ